MSKFAQLTVNVTTPFAEVTPPGSSPTQREHPERYRDNKPKMDYRMERGLQRSDTNNFGVHLRALAVLRVCSTGGADGDGGCHVLGGA